MFFLMCAILIFLIIVTALVCLFWAGAGVYNMLVSLRQNVENGLAQIDVQLQRRHDLIDNLVETVKGYASHESKTLTDVIRARNQAVIADGIQSKAKAEGELTAALRQMLVTVENYPNLKADKFFIDLQDELTSTENKISITRQSYNDQVAQYNTSIQMFPSNMIANHLDFSIKYYLEIDACEKDKPKVKF